MSLLSRFARRHSHERGPWTDLVDEVREHGWVEVREMTDEEIAVLLADVGGLDAMLVAPRLAAMSDRERAVALHTTARVLLANGTLVDADGLRIPQAETRTYVAGRSHPTAAAMVERHHRDRPMSPPFLLYRIDRGVYLCEDISFDGVHRSTFCDPDHAAAQLASIVHPAIDRDARATAGGELDTTDEHAARARIDELVAACDVSSRVSYRGLDLPDRGVVRSFTVYSFADGACWLYTGHRTPDGASRHAIALMGAKRLVAYCRTFLGSDLDGDHA
jgi:hypothetical protein